MASSLLFSSAPSFPNDTPVARIARISLEKLATGDELEAEALLSACVSLGFFLFDLKGNTEGEELIKDVDGTFEALDETMDMSLEEKLRYRDHSPECFTG